MPRHKIDWPPAKHLWPAGFSVHRDGWAKSYRGQTIVISGKKRTPDEVKRLFADRCAIFDKEQPLGIPTGNNVTLTDLAASFFADLDRRVAMGDISARHAENVITECRRFGKFTKGYRLASAIGAAEFSAYYNRFVKPTSSPYTIQNIVGRIGLMFRWAMQNGVLKNVIFGSAWRAPPAKKRKAHRLKKGKTFPPEDIGRIYRHCTPMWKRWMELAIVGGFTNSDLANMTWEVFDGEVVDYRRRKDGEVRRVIALPPEVLARIKSTPRPKPASPQYANHVFLDDLGKPYDMVGSRSQSAREFRQIMEAADTYIKGRAFTGLRTTCFNELLYASALVRGLIIGRVPEGMSAIDWENYCERVDIEPIREAVSAIWEKFKSQLSDASPSVVSPERRPGRKPKSPRG